MSPNYFIARSCTNTFAMQGHNWDPYGVCRICHASQCTAFNSSGGQGGSTKGRRCQHASSPDGNGKCRLHKKRVRTFA